MFRKPKKITKGKQESLRRRRRSPSDDADARYGDVGDDGRNVQDVDNGGEARAGAGVGRDPNKGRSFRKRPAGDEGSASASDVDEEGTANDTSSLLDQIKRERDEKRTTTTTTTVTKPFVAGAMKRKSRTTTTANTTTAEMAIGKDGVMHEFASSDPSLEMTGVDMATRGAEYHPLSSTPSSAGNQQQQQQQNQKKQPPRNKFLAGPIKAPTFVRTTCRFDYQPDICKDYKDTGFCGFGDTCIYLHDRGDTMTGWQLEQQYEERKKKEEERKRRELDKFLERANREGGGSDGSDEDGTGGEGEGEGGRTGASGKDALSDDGLPFACHICRGPFKDPIVTTCGHYFCQGCILERVQGRRAPREEGGRIANAYIGDGGGDSTCPICSKDTRGVFNAPTKLESKKRRIAGSESTWEEFMEASKKRKKKTK